MQPQRAALAAGKVIRGLLDKGYVASVNNNKLARYEITGVGSAALEAGRVSAIDPRQLSILPE